MNDSKPLRNLYLKRFYFRILIFILIAILYFIDIKSFYVMTGWNFFKNFSLLHILWIIWVHDMVRQLIPSKNKLSLGSQKQFKMHFIPVHNKEISSDFKAYIRKSNYASLIIFILWILLCSVIGCFKYFKIIGNKELLLISVIFYIGDLICVLFWCPFRDWFLKNRCCTTCRIFNWDHLMMFSPLLFVKGFYTLSLFIFALLIFIIWEICIITHPERFFEGTNKALECNNCSDNMCGMKNQKIDDLHELHISKNIFN